MPVRDSLGRRPWAVGRATTVAIAVTVVALLTLVVTLTRLGRDGGAVATAPPAVPERPQITGEDYAVAPRGDDDATGTAEDPWQTLEHALGQLEPGDRLTVADGRYEEDIDLQVEEGTRESPIQVVAAEGARPVVEGLLWLSDLSWWDVRGINVTWADRNDDDDHMVKLTDGEGWRFADAELWGAESYAALLVAGDPEDFMLSGLYVHDTKPSNDNNQDHLIYLNCGTGGGVLERSILAHSSNGRAVKVGTSSKGNGEVANIVIRYVTMVDNRGPSNVQLAWEASNITVENSILVGSAEGRSSVTAFDLEGENNVVRDSLSWDSARLIDDAPGLEDGGGNVRLDPDLSGPRGDRPYYPREPRAQGFGRWAPAQ